MRFADCVQRGLVGTVTARFENRGYKLCGLKITTPHRALAEAHYDEHRGKEVGSALVPGTK